MLVSSLRLNPRLFAQHCNAQRFLRLCSFEYLNLGDTSATRTGHRSLLKSSGVAKELRVELAGGDAGWGRETERDGGGRKRQAGERAAQCPPRRFLMTVVGALQLNGLVDREGV